VAPSQFGQLNLQKKTKPVVTEKRFVHNSSLHDSGEPRIEEPKKKKKKTIEKQ